VNIETPSAPSKAASIQKGLGLALFLLTLPSLFRAIDLPIRERTAVQATQKCAAHYDFICLGAANHALDEVIYDRTNPPWYTLQHYFSQI
jgi:hypothetical protein